jgi:hypothetical protein
VSGWMVVAFSKFNFQIKLFSSCWYFLLGSDLAWALSDTTLDGEYLWLARRRAESE